MTSASGQPSKGEASVQYDSNISPGILETIIPSLKIGVLAGVAGIVFGGFGGIIRSRTPAMFALASGIQWFTLGTTFHGSRSILLDTWGSDKTTPDDRIYASAIAGSVSGGAGGLLRGPKNILPGAIMFALFGAAGQYIYNQKAQSSAGATEGLENNKWLKSKWSPVKVLSDEEYEDMLREKLLRINVEIAVIDDNIAALRAQEREMAARENRKEDETPDSK